MPPLSVLYLATNSSIGFGWSLNLRRLVVGTTGLASIGGTTQGVRGPVDNGEHDQCKKEDKENKNAGLPRGHNIPQPKA